MEILTHQEYELYLNDVGSYELRTDGVLCTFSAPATIRGVSKLYVVGQRKKLIYIGIARQPIASRLRGGLKATGKSGYHGYKWKGERGRLDFHVFTLRAGDKSIDLKDMEAIEAEVAFLCRLDSNQWPAFQNEIHFQKSNKSHRVLAQKIYQLTTKMISKDKGKN